MKYEILREINATMIIIVDHSWIHLLSTIDSFFLLYEEIAPNPTLKIPHDVQWQQLESTAM